MMENLSLQLAGILLFMTSKVSASADRGEKTWVYSTCVRNCVRRCDGFSRKDDHILFQWMELFVHGTCWEQCPYACMWNTVRAYEMDRSTIIPKFYGKWPYLRFLGMEKPVACLVAAVNIISHILLLRYFRQKVKNSIRMFYVWHVYSLISIHQWFWTVVYNFRELPISERLFHFSGILLVLCSVWLVLIRIITNGEIWKHGLVTLIIGIWFVYHVTYHLMLYHGKQTVDKQYDEQASVVWGLFRTLLWIFWSVHQKPQHPYLWKLRLALIGTALLSSLQQYDFPPLLWLVDADMLSYAGTAAVQPLWYSFAVDDCHYLMDGQSNHNSAKEDPCGGKIPQDNDNLHIQSESN